MEFRTPANRAGRRRRVLIDELATASGDGADSPTETALDPADPPQKCYADPALASRQRRVTDLIPTRVWTLSVGLLVALSVVAGLQALYSRLVLGGLPPGLRQWPALDPSQPASFAGWFSAMLFALASAGGVLIYSLRRHRTDDYRGRYRLWLWVVAILLAASADAVTGLHLAAIGLLADATRWPTVSTAETFWTGAYGVFLAAAGVRLAVEMRRCRTALLALMLAAGSYGVATWLDYSEALGGSGPLMVMAQSTAVLLGHVLLTLTFALYARYVYLQAQGVLPSRARAGSAKRADDGSAPSRRSVRGRKNRRQTAPAGGKDTPTASAAAAGSTSAAGSSRREKARPTSRGAAGSASIEALDSGSAAESRVDSGDAGEGRRLSKAERRRLRKKMRRERSGHAG